MEVDADKELLVSNVVNANTLDKKKIIIIIIKIKKQIKVEYQQCPPNVEADDALIASTMIVDTDALVQKLKKKSGRSTACT